MLDTGATSHVTKHEGGEKGHHESDVCTRGAMGGTVDTSYQIDIPVFFCNKMGKRCLPCNWMMSDEQGLQFQPIQYDKDDAEWLWIRWEWKRIDSKKDEHVFKFDIVIHTRHGLLFCKIFIMRLSNEED